MDANSLTLQDQAFIFIGLGAFTKKAGQLRYEIDRGTAEIYGDIDGDGRADFLLEVENVTKLSKSDFIL